MRILIDHTSVYQYSRRAQAIIQVLRLEPRSYAGQRVAAWRIDPGEHAHMRTGEDAYGNITHTLYTDRPVDRLALHVTGEVETFDAQGVVNGAIERLPQGVFLRETPLTETDAAMDQFADDTLASAPADTLGRMHHLLVELHRQVAFETGMTDTTTTAADAFGQGRGVCQDLAHIFIAMARRDGIPARYVSGHLSRPDGTERQEASHAWAEARVDGLGWVGFDPANGVCPTDAYVRVAVGLDYLGAAPVRGVHYGGGIETMSVDVHVRQASGQSQE